MSTTKITLTVSGILADLQNGYSRTTSDKSYQGGGKSIEEKYGLNKTEVKELFLHEKLKNKKTILPRENSFVLVDDTTDDNTQAVQTENAITDSSEGEISEVEQPVADANWASLS